MKSKKQQASIGSLLTAYYLPLTTHCSKALIAADVENQVQHVTEDVVGAV